MAAISQITVFGVPADLSPLLVACGRPAAAARRRRALRLRRRPADRHRAAADARRVLAAARDDRLRRGPPARAARPRARPRPDGRRRRRRRDRHVRLRRSCSSCSASTCRSRCCWCARSCSRSCSDTLLALPVYALVRRILLPVPPRRPAPPPPPGLHDRRAVARSRAPSARCPRRAPPDDLAAARAARGDPRRRRVRAVRDHLLPAVVPAGALGRDLRVPGRAEPRPQDPHRGAARQHRRPQRHGRSSRRARRRSCRSLPDELPESERDLRGRVRRAGLGRRARAPRRGRPADARSTARRRARGQAEGSPRRSGASAATSRAPPARRRSRSRVPPLPADPELRDLYRRLGRRARPQAASRSTGASIQQVAQTPYAAVTVKTDIGRPAFNYLRSARTSSPACRPETQYLRDYPHEGARRAPVRHAARDLAGRARARAATATSSRASGSARTASRSRYDRFLRGQDGYYRQVVDALGQACDDPVRCAVRDVKPQQGQQLRADARPRRCSARPRRRCSAITGAAAQPPGAFVAMDPRNGEILALGSYPSFDANLFAKPITQEKYDALNSEDARHAAVQPRDRRRLSRPARRSS